MPEEHPLTIASCSIAGLALHFCAQDESFGAFKTWLQTGEGAKYLTAEAMKTLGEVEPGDLYKASNFLAMVAINSMPSLAKLLGGEQ